MKNMMISDDEQFKKLERHIGEAPNVQQHYTRFYKVLKQNFKECLRKQNTSEVSNTTKAFELKFAQHERHPAYMEARQRGLDSEWITIQREI